MNNSDNHRIDSFMYGMSDFAGMKIHIDPGMVDIHTETLIYKGHPIIQWLAKYLKFNPDVVQVIERTTPKKNALKFNNMLVMHPKTARDLRAMIDTSSLTV